MATMESSQERKKVKTSPRFGRHWPNGLASLPKIATTCERQSARNATCGPKAAVRGPGPLGRRPIGGFLRKESHVRLRLPDSGLLRLCPVSFGSGHVRSYSQTDRRVRFRGSLWLDRYRHSRPLNRLFSCLSADVTWISGERSFAPTAYRLRPIFLCVLGDFVVEEAVAGSL